MAKENRKFGKAFWIISPLLTIIIIVGIISYFHFDEKIKEKIKKNKEIDENIISKYDVLGEREKELREIIEEKTKYDNLEEKLNNLKAEYPKTIKKLEDNIISGKSSAKIAYLTFDDGPYYNTYKVLDILDKYNVKATFFTTSINGEYCYDNKKENCLKLYKEYVKRGHTIANHTYTHGIFKGLYNSTDSFMDAIIKQENQVKTQTGGYVTNIMRFPGGSNTAGKLKSSIIEALRKRGYGWVDWSAGDGDGGNLTSKTQAWNNLKPRIDSNIEVILFHDYSPITTAILPEVIEYLQNRGYILLPLFYESNMINK